MQSYKRTIRFFLLAALATVMVTAIAALPGHGYNSLVPMGQDRANIQNKSQDSQMPIASYLASVPTNPAARDLRRARSSQYDKRRPEPISELPAGREELPLISHWRWGVTPLPSAQSDAVVVGEVIDAKAYLSNDKTGVYSEFTARVKEVLKDSNQIPLNLSDSVTLEREGGAVRFPSGRVQQYHIAHQNMPRVGRQYVLFLKRNDPAQDFSILTAYELHDGRVLPLDSIDQFAAYKDTDESSFVNAVRDSIAHPEQAHPPKGGEN